VAQTVDAQPMQQAAPASSAAQALMAAVALAPAQQAAAEAANDGVAQPAAAGAEAPARQQPPPADAAKSVESPNVGQAKAKEIANAPDKGAASEAPTTVSLWGVAGKTLLPILLLAGVAFAALKLSRRRRQLGRHVRILETTTLGPRRSLIVAKVGNETLLLGASEAGISLIQVRPVDQDRHDRDDDVDTEVAPKSFTKSAPDDNADDGLWVDAMDVKGAVSDESPEAGQVRMLARLFRKRRRDVPEAWPFANVLDASLMEESVEDRELREKLVLGMEARVP